VLVGMRTCSPRRPVCPAVCRTPLAHPHSCCHGRLAAPMSPTNLTKAEGWKKTGGDLDSCREGKRGASAAHRAERAERLSTPAGR